MVERPHRPCAAARFAVEILSQLDKLHSFQRRLPLTDSDESVVHGGDPARRIFRSVRTMKCGCSILAIAKALTFTHSRTRTLPSLAVRAIARPNA